MTVSPANELVEMGKQPLRIVVCNRWVHVGWPLNLHWVFLAFRQSGVLTTQPTILEQIFFFCTICSLLPFPASHLGENKNQTWLVSGISFSWLADFGTTLNIVIWYTPWWKEQLQTEDLFPHPHKKPSHEPPPLKELGAALARSHKNGLIPLRETKETMPVAPKQQLLHYDDK